MSLIGYVVLGSALGAPARYLLDTLIQSRHERVLPWGTWVINVSGCFALGLLTGIAQDHVTDARVMATVATGFLGSYTTFSTFTWETMRMVEDGVFVAALANIALSVAVGMAAAAAGLLLAAVI